jgi:hypothetical protein
MSTQIETYHLGAYFFADANVLCDFCGAKSETQGACGAGAREDASGSAKAHAKVAQKWTETTVPVREGRKTYALVRDRCAACSGKVAA